LKHYIFLIVLLYTGCGNPEYAAELYNKGQIQYMDKNLAEAGRLFTETLKFDDEFLNAYLMLAKIHYYNRDYNSAVKYIDSILERDRDHAGGLYWKARILVISGKDDPDEPVRILRSVLEKDSHHIPARMLLALVYEKNRKYKEALHEYITVLEEEQDLINARGNLAVLYRRMGLKERALNEIDRAVKVATAAGREVKTLNFIKGEFEKWEEK